MKASAKVDRSVDLQTTNEGPRRNSPTIVRAGTTQLPRYSRLNATGRKTCFIVLHTAVHPPSMTMDCPVM
jgi:hypothetical protein